MRSEVFTSRVSKIGMIFLATSENKSHSLVSKRDLESTVKFKNKILKIKNKMCVYCGFEFGT